MAYIAHKEKNFEKFLMNHFGISIPEGISIFYKEGIRIGSNSIRNSNIIGEFGYAAADAGFNPTHSFIHNFGHLAKKNRINLTYVEAKSFAAGSDLSCDFGKSSKYVIAIYKDHAIGLGQYDPNQKKLINKIPKKATRDMINEF